MYELILNRGFEKLSESRVDPQQMAAFGAATGALGTGAYVASDFAQRYRGGANAGAAQRLMSGNMGMAGHVRPNAGGGHTLTGTQRGGNARLLQQGRGHLPKDLRVRTSMSQLHQPGSVRSGFDNAVRTNFKHAPNARGASSMGKSVRFGDKARSLVKNMGRGGKLMALGTLGTAAAAGLYANYHNRS
jgi:hypothetical protein